MELSKQTLEQIGGYVRQNLGTWIRDLNPALTVQLDGNSIERLVRVEEEIKHIRLDTNARFEAMRADTAARFEAVDKRFEETRTDMAARFEAVDKRFEEARSHTNHWMTFMTIVLGVMGAAMTLAIVLVG